MRNGGIGEEREKRKSAPFQPPGPAYLAYLLLFKALFIILEAKDSTREAEVIRSESHRITGKSTACCRGRGGRLLIVANEERNKNGMTL